MLRERQHFIPFYFTFFFTNALYVDEDVKNILRSSENVQFIQQIF